MRLNHEPGGVHVSNPFRAGRGDNYAARKSASSSLFCFKPLQSGAGGQLRCLRGRSNSKEDVSNPFRAGRGDNSNATRPSPRPRRRFQTPSERGGGTITTLGESSTPSELSFKPLQSGAGGQLETLKKGVGGDAGVSNPFRAGREDNCGRLGSTGLAAMRFQTPSERGGRTITFTPGLCGSQASVRSRRSRPAPPVAVAVCRSGLCRVP